MNISDMKFEPWMSGSFWEYCYVGDAVPSIIVYRALAPFSLGGRDIKTGCFHIIVHGKENLYVDTLLEAQCVIWHLVEKYR